MDQSRRREEKEEDEQGDFGLFEEDDGALKGEQNRTAGWFTAEEGHWVLDDAGSLG